jgi:hypothetical protein
MVCFNLFFIKITYDKYKLKKVFLLMFNNSIETKNNYCNWKCNFKIKQAINVYNRYKTLK